MICIYIVRLFSLITLHVGLKCLHATFYDLNVIRCLEKVCMCVIFEVYLSMMVFPMKPCVSDL